jgi:hypothetical protein
MPFRVALDDTDSDEDELLNFSFAASLHHAADWLATHGVCVSASTLYAMYYRHRWEGNSRGKGVTKRCSNVAMQCIRIAEPRARA